MSQPGNTTRRYSTQEEEFIIEQYRKRTDPLLTKTNSPMRVAIPPVEGLAVTLRFLATGETQSSLSFQFRISQCTICGILAAACDATYSVLREEFLKLPNTVEEWKRVADAFSDKWNFPMCIGAMDGNHVKPNSGSVYYNYKGDFSIVLLAVVDANLKFLYVDIGTSERVSDGGVWGKNMLKYAMDNNLLNIPEAERIPGTTDFVPFVLVDDDAFPLMTNIVKPYPGRDIDERKRIFNYRLPRARRVSENAFGLHGSRFQLYRAQIKTSPLKAQKYVLATCCLHNLLRKSDEDGNYQNWMTEGSRLIPLQRLTSHPNSLAKQVQLKFCDFFNGSGAVPWQNEICNLH